MMQCTAKVHHHVANSGFPHSPRLCEPTAACDVAVELLDASAPPSKRPLPRVLCPRQLVPTRLRRGLEDVHAVQTEGLNARILPQLTPCWQRLGCSLGAARAMATTRRRLAQAKEA
jgi:hypothetical protein